jgi:hypothetical protein
MRVEERACAASSAPRVGQASSVLEVGELGRCGRQASSKAALGLLAAARRLELASAATKGRPAGARAARPSASEHARGAGRRGCIHKPHARRGPAIGSCAVMAGSMR